MYRRRPVNRRRLTNLKIAFTYKGPLIFIGPPISAESANPLMFTLTEQKTAKVQNPSAKIARRLIESLSNRYRRRA